MAAHLVVAVVVLGGHWTMAQPAPCGNSCPIGEELGFPENIRVGQLAENQVTLTLTEFFYDGYPATFWTRAFAANGAAPQIPGPTLRLRAGMKFSIKLENALGPNPVGGPTEENSFRLCNTTNLHTHGLHESPTAPADTVLVSVDPGESRTYEYTVVPDHMGGTFWYHPHFHGSSALQVGGGAAGVFVVEDEPGDVPPYVANAPESVMLFQNWYMPDSGLGLRSISKQMQDDLIEPTYATTGNPGTENLDSVWWTINGQFEPKITLQAGEMVRWRMASASISEVLELTLDGCSFHLIAKDGVYLQDAPRTVPAIYLSPASRADVMIQCMDPGTYSLRSDDLTSGHTVNTTGTPAQPGFAAQSAIASVVVRASTAQPDTQPPGVNVSRVPRGFSPGFPNYLADLQRLPPRLRGSMQHWSVSLGVNGLDVNGVKYAPDNPLQVFQTGRVIEWQINPSHASGHQHPLHLHVWPFQITALPKQSGKNVYYQVGDFHDTIQLGLESEAGDEMTVRFQTTTFKGDVMLHCHILAHEDSGMMAMVRVVGPSSEVVVFSQHPVCTLSNGYRC